MRVCAVESVCVYIESNERAVVQERRLSLMQGFPLCLLPERTRADFVLTTTGELTTTTHTHRGNTGSLS